MSVWLTMVAVVIFVKIHWTPIHVDVMRGTGWTKMVRIALVRNVLAFNTNTSRTNYNFIDVDECVIGDHGCEQECVNNIGSHTCECGSGYVLDSNGKTCSISCGGLLSSTSGSFQTPGWPDSYPQEDFTCEWTISVSNTSTLQFEVDSSAYGINGRPPCRRDHIEFFDGLESDSQSIGRFCKLKVPEPITVTTGAARVIFEGNKNPKRPPSRIGVRVLYKTID